VCVADAETQEPSGLCSRVDAGQDDERQVRGPRRISMTERGRIRAVPFEDIVDGGHLVPLLSV